MFILIPSIIIFLALSYLQLSEETTLFERSIIYIIVAGTIFISFKVYRNLKHNMKQQEINKILLEIKELENRFSKLEDETQKNHLRKKIEKLKDELNN